MYEILNNGASIEYKDLMLKLLMLPVFFFLGFLGVLLIFFLFIFVVDK